METAEKFMEKGHLLSPEAFSFLQNKNIDEFLNKKYDKLVLARADFLADFKILKNLTAKPREVRTEDFIIFYKSKYERMKNIILSRIQKEFISLNKVDSSRQEVYVIGIVKERKQKDEKHILEIEDMTGSMPVIFDDEPGVNTDDVIAINGLAGGKVIYGKKVLFPDIPLRSPNTGQGTACFVSDLHMDEMPIKEMEKFFGWMEKENINYLFVAGDIGDRKKFEELVHKYCSDKTVFVIPGNMDNKDDYPQVAEKYESDNIVSLSNPAIVEAGGLKILMIHEMQLEMLKKRYLGKSKTILKDDFLVLDEVPDIVHFGHTHEPQIMNYKSVTLVNSGSPLVDFRPVVINFATREAEFVKMD